MSITANSHTCPESESMDSLALAVAAFEAAALSFLRTFNSCARHTRSVVIETQLSDSALHGWDYRLGAASLASGVAAVAAHDDQDLDPRVIEAAELLRAAAALVMVEFSSINASIRAKLGVDGQEYPSLALSVAGRPDVTSLAAGVALAVSAMRFTDDIGLTIDLWGDGGRRPLALDEWLWSGPSGAVMATVTPSP